MKRSSGFTLVEIAVVLAILGLLGAAIIPNISDRMLQARAGASIEQARMILQVCESARKNVLTSTMNAQGQMVHTYPSLPNWASTQALQALLSKNYDLPVKNSLGTDFLVKFDSARCYVAVDLTFLQDNYAGMETLTVNGNTRVIVTSKPSRSVNPSWVISQKRFLSGEATR
ncbi:prepilin-type N-terminal cleavage/methylation domain-containing protein [Pseudomonas frederiksbergensis]|uniref:type II secretion system protein n=1 Tax=Pseudomonas TaxID=286 RepID=UPI003D248680